MKESGLKNIFYISSLLLLILMIFSSREAGITCDEVLHYNHSVTVYNYFLTHGADKSALDTPVTHLKYYGQSYDNLVTFLIKWLNIDNIYRFRHLMCSIAGWLVIFVTAYFAVWLAGIRAGIFVLILFVVSPVFFGHSLNNLKDIPFALGYITSIFFTIRFLFAERRHTFFNIILLVAGIALSLSIRAGGLLLICYLFFFFVLFYLFTFLKNKRLDLIEIRTKLVLITAIIIISWSLSIILWPYALQNPIRNMLESYRVMAHFPDTFRQIFEGEFEWSDYMPWYYLPKSMAITIPFIIFAGLTLFIIYSKRVFVQGRALLYWCIIFTILFPVVFVIIGKSNLYSSWRQFLFVYPVIILLSAIGFQSLLDNLKNKYLKWIVFCGVILLSIHPVKFMILNHPYYYLYYNQLVGGLSGAYSNYETDYYYVSQTEASEWLIDYLKGKNFAGGDRVYATYPVQWLFRNYPQIETSYFRYEERSLYDWDYAIVANRYIQPFQLRNNIWPPQNAIHVIYADKIPVCAVIERKSKDDYKGYMALSEGRYRDAVDYFRIAVKNDINDEMVFCNYAAALYNTGQYQKADSVLKAGLEINPYFEPILMYLGNIARARNKKDEAVKYYKQLIAVNRKYFDAYIALSGLLIEEDILQARTILRRCLVVSPGYKPAILALADTYRVSNPDIARKYDDLAKSIE